DSTLADYCLRNHIDAKSDLATVFLDRLLRSSALNGITSIVIPQNWLFLTTYKKFRKKLLKKYSWVFVCRLGAGAISQISGEVVKAVLIGIQNRPPVEKESFFALDISEIPGTAQKAESLKIKSFNILNQT